MADIDGVRLGLMHTAPHPLCLHLTPSTADGWPNHPHTLYATISPQCTLALLRWPLWRGKGDTFSHSQYKFQLVST